jgi:hypothetical protein
VGPAKQPDKFENTGRASHIFAAAKRGPRGRGNLSSDELRSVANGIWLCAKHADQVDKNKGKDYPPPVLLGWKAAHEFRMAREHGAILHPFGWIESLHIIDTPVFKPNQRITFANANVLVGSNGVGKTTICEWLMSLKDLLPLRRWGAYPTHANREFDYVKVAFDLRAPARQHAELEISGGRLNFVLDGRKMPFSPIGYEVSALSREPNLHVSHGDQVFIARCLQMDEISVQSLAEHINECPGIFLKVAEWREERDEESDEPIRCLYCGLANGVTHPFRALSSGESAAVLVDLAMAKARILAAHRPALLIIETGWSIDG